jgi:hypothetical protein
MRYSQEAIDGARSSGSVRRPYCAGERVFMNDCLAASTNKIVLGFNEQPTLPAGMQAVLQLEKANAQQELNKSLLRLTFLMQQSE